MGGVRIEMVTIRSKKLLTGITLLRTLFIPLFLLCNVSRSNTLNSIPLINSDTLFLVLMSLFAFSNGYTSTCIMLTAIIDPGLEKDEVDVRFFPFPFL